MEFKTGGDDFTMDWLDLDILRGLHANCRTSYEETARRLCTSSATIRNRVQNLRNAGTLGQFLIKLSWSAIKGRKVLGLVQTGGTEQRDDFPARLGNDIHIEWVSFCGAARYFLQAVCRDIDEYSRLQVFLGSFPEIISVELHPINGPGNVERTITGRQARILSHLLDDPRSKSTEIAKSLGISSRSVAREISRLQNSGLVEFTLECFFSSLIAVVEYNGDMCSSTEVEKELEQGFDCIWQLATSSNEPIVFACFFLEYVEDLHSTLRKLELKPFEVRDVIIAEPRRYFTSLRDTELRNLIRTA